MVNVNLAANRFQLLDADMNLYSSATYVSIDGISPSTVSDKYVGFDMSTAAALRASAFGSGVQVITETVQWSVRVQLRTGVDVMIPLGQVANKPTWTNDLAGFTLAEAAIYAAFP